MSEQLANFEQSSALTAKDRQMKDFVTTSPQASDRASALKLVNCDLVNEFQIELNLDDQTGCFLLCPSEPFGHSDKGLASGKATNHTNKQTTEAVEAANAYIISQSTKIAESCANQTQFAINHFNLNRSGIQTRQPDYSNQASHREISVVLSRAIKECVSLHIAKSIEAELRFDDNRNKINQVFPSESPKP